MKTVITDIGIKSILNASSQGPQIKVSSVKIGSSIINPLSTMTDVTNLVWSGDSSYISYHIIDDNTFLFRITLDETIGDFDVGNIGLFLESGDLFAITTLLGIEKKEATSVTSSGNRRIYEIIVTVSGISNLIDLTVLNASSANLATVENENSLPTPQNALFNCYLVKYNTISKLPCLAILYGQEWKYLPVKSKETIANFEVANFDSGVKEGDAVYFDFQSKVFKKATNNTDYIGLVDSNQNVINTGNFYSTQLNLLPGYSYYVSENEGVISQNISKNYVGLAINEHTLLLSSGIETKNFKVNIIDSSNPSNFKYTSENAVVSYAADKNFSNITQQAKEVLQGLNTPPIGSYTIQFDEGNGNFNASESPNVLYPNTTWQLLFNDQSVFFRTEGTLSNESRVNGLQGDAIRNIYGQIGSLIVPVNNMSGAFAGTNVSSGSLRGGSGGWWTAWNYDFNASRVVPTGSENRPVNRLIRVWKRIS